jgi:hypothetical protein
MEYVQLEIAYNTKIVITLAVVSVSSSMIIKMVGATIRTVCTLMSCTVQVVRMGGIKTKMGTVLCRTASSMINRVSSV